jgi:hypothetical protein
MSAPDLQTLFHFEDAIENCLASILTAGGLTVHKQQSTDQLATPFVALQFTPGRATQRLKCFTSTAPRYDAWEGSLRVEIVTERKKNGANHAVIRATIRNLFYDAQAQITTDNLPWHAVTKFYETSTSPTVSHEDNFDVSSMTWAMEFQIRSTAWPIS